MNRTEVTGKLMFTVRPIRRRSSDSCVCAAWDKPDVAAEWRAKREEITTDAAGEEPSHAED